MPFPLPAVPLTPTIRGYNTPPFTVFRILRSVITARYSRSAAIRDETYTEALNSRHDTLLICVVIAEDRNTSVFREANISILIDVGRFVIYYFFFFN